MRMTSGFTLAYFACVRKFRPTRPRARSARRTSAILRYVFITSAEPYSSTNSRFAFSRVFGLRSATVADMAKLLPQRMKVQDAGNHPDDADAQAEQDRSREGDEEEAPE